MCAWACNARMATSSASGSGAAGAAGGVPGKSEAPESFDGAAGAADAGFAFEARAAETQAAADAVVDVEAVAFDDWVGRRPETGPRAGPAASRDGRDDDDHEDEDEDEDEDEGFPDATRTFSSAADAAAAEARDGFADDRSSPYRSAPRDRRGDRRGDRRDAYASGGYDRWADASRNALDDAARLAAEALGVDGAGRGGREVAGSRSGERANRWREFLTGRFYGAFQEDVVPVRFAREDDASEATAERMTQTVPANGRFANGAWTADPAPAPEGGDDENAPSRRFGGSLGGSSEGDGGDEDDVRGTTR